MQAVSRTEMVNIASVLNTCFRMIPSPVAGLQIKPSLWLGIGKVILSKSTLVNELVLMVGAHKLDYSM